MSRASRVKLIVVVVSIVVGSVLAASPCYARCTKDTDCKGDRICTNGQCARPLACTKDTDCRGDLICEDGQCGKPTTKVGSTGSNSSSNHEVERSLLLIKLGDTKRKRTNSAVTMGLGFGLGVVFLIGGGIWFAAAPSDGKVLPAIFLGTGGIEILLGIVGTALYVTYNSQVTSMEHSLEISGNSNSQPTLGLTSEGLSSTGIVPFQGKSSASYTPIWSVHF